MCYNFFGNRGSIIYYSVVLKPAACSLSVLIVIVFALSIVKPIFKDFDLGEESPAAAAAPDEEPASGAATAEGGDLA